MTVRRCASVSEVAPDSTVDEAMRVRIQHEIPDLEIEAETYSTWHIENYRQLTKKERGPIFQCGGYPWSVFFNMHQVPMLTKWQENSSFSLWQ